jgi:hypothetical protein
VEPDIPVKVLVSDRAAPYVTEEYKQALCEQMVWEARERGMERGESLFHLEVAEDGTSERVVALDRRAGGDHEWVLLIDPDGLGLVFDTGVGPQPSTN